MNNSVENSSNIAENNKRLAKNTAFLYIRMFLMLIVSLYTSRIILKVLGIQDFGIYNVVAGIVVLFSFINGAMSIASQRFMSIALGGSDVNKITKVFSMSFTSHLAISLIVFCLAETVGLLVLNQMNFPADRINAVFWTFHIAILTCCVNIIRVPYNASIIAHERMSFYAWISIIEVFLKLLIVVALNFYSGDKLIFYSFLLLLVTVIITLVYKIYNNRNYSSTKYHFFWDASLFKEYISFSGWSLFGSLASVSAQQGLNMIINVFCGVMVNAAVGIANQVMSAVQLFLGNFQTAFNPQLVKSYAGGNHEYFINLVLKSSKFSYYLLLILSLPLIINCKFILGVWLDDVPNYAVEFSQLMIVFLLFEAISGPLWISIQATGKIRKYQMIISSLMLLNLPVAIVLMLFKLSPISIFIARVLINGLALCVRILYLRPLINLSLNLFFNKVVLPIVVVTVLILPIPIITNKFVAVSWLSVIFNIVICLILSGFVIYFFGLTNGERTVAQQIIIKLKKHLYKK